MSKMNPKPDTYIFQLDAMRFAAIFWIVVFHCGRQVYTFNSIFILQELAASGNLFVGFFFSLSGYVLALRYYGEPIDYRDYVFARIARIYPLHLGVVIAFTLLFLFQGTLIEHLPAIACNVLLVQAWASPYPLSLNSPAWYLSCLMFFYIIFPYLIRLFEQTALSLTALLIIAFYLLSFIVMAMLLQTVYVGFPSTSHDIVF